MGLSTSTLECYTKLQLHTSVWLYFQQQQNAKKLMHALFDDDGQMTNKKKKKLPMIVNR